MKCTDTAWEASGTCRSSGGCEVSGKIGGKIDFLRKSGTNVQTLLERALTGTTTLDAAGIAIDISQSTVQVPATGQLTINLVDSSTGQTQASRVFSWTRTGLKLVLSDPNAVNTWAMQSGGTADSLQYKLHTFAVSESSGWNTLAQEVTYEGEPQAYATTTWRGQICPNDPLRREDRRQGIRYCQ